MTRSIQYSVTRLSAGEYLYVLYSRGRAFVSYRVYRIKPAAGRKQWQIQQTDGMQAFLGPGSRTLAEVPTRIGQHWGDRWTLEKVTR